MTGTQCDQARKKVCGACTRKGKLRPISENALRLLRKHHCPDYDTDIYPSVICDSCYRCLIEVESKLIKGLVPIRTLPHISYDDKKAPRVTRSSDNQPCSCFWCRVARMYGKEYMDHCNSVRPRPVKSPPKPDTIKICSKCKGVIHRGVSHTCNMTEAKKNVSSMVRESFPDGGKAAVAGLLNKICEDENVNKRTGTLTLPSGSKEKVINFGKKETLPQVSIDDLVKLGMSRHLSDRDLTALSTAIRRKFGRRSVESGLQEKLPKLKLEVKDFFVLRAVEVYWKRGKKEGVETKYLVMAEEIMDLVEKIMIERHIDPDQAELQSGIDDGQGILKVYWIKMFIWHGNAQRSDTWVVSYRSEMDVHS